MILKNCNTANGTPSNALFKLVDTLLALISSMNSETRNTRNTRASKLFSIIECLNRTCTEEPVSLR